MIDIKKNPEAVGKLKVGTSAATPASGEVVATSVKAETYRSARSDGDIYIQAATASDFVAIGTQLSSTLLKVDGSGDTTLDGKLKLDDASVAGWIQSNGSVRVDIDNDDSSTDRAFVVSRDNASATLFSVNELGNVLVGAAALDANLGAKKMQLEGSASTSVGPEMLLHNPAQGGGAASLLTFGGKASGTEGYTAAIKATNTGSFTIGTAHASGGFSEPAADLTISSTGDVTVNESLAIGTTPTSGVSLNVRENSTTTAADIRNTNASGYGLYIAGGSTSSHYALKVAPYDNSTSFLTVRGDGLAEFGNGIKNEQGIYGGQITIADDAVGTITPPRQGVMMAISYGNDTAYPAHGNTVAIIWCDTGSSLTCAKLTGEGTNISVFNAVNLSAAGETSSVDNNINISTTSNTIQIKNRLGGTFEFWYNFIA